MCLRNSARDSRFFGTKRSGSTAAVSSSDSARWESRMTRFVVITLLAAVCGCASHPLTLGENENLRMGRVASAIISVTERDKDRFKQEVARMNAREINLTVSTLAAVYWTPRWSNELRLDGPALVASIDRISCDRSPDELLRIARYSQDRRDVSLALNSHWLHIRRSFEFVPTYLEISRRKDIEPEDVELARCRAAVTIFPITYGEVKEQLERSGIYALDVVNNPLKRDAVFKKIEQECVDEDLRVQHEILTPDWWRGSIGVLRRSRGETDLSVVIPPLTGTLKEEQAVVALAKDMLPAKP